MPGSCLRPLAGATINGGDVLMKERAEAMGRAFCLMCGLIKHFFGGDDLHYEWKCFMAKWETTCGG